MSPHFLFIVEFAFVDGKNISPIFAFLLIFVLISLFIHFKIFEGLLDLFQLLFILIKILLLFVFALAFFLFLLFLFLYFLFLLIILFFRFICLDGNDLLLFALGLIYMRHNVPKAANEKAAFLTGASISSSSSMFCGASLCLFF